MIIWYNIRMEELNIKSNVRVTFYNEKTRKKRVVLKHNVTTDAGMGSIAERLSGSESTGVVTYMALGTGTAVPNASDTVMDTELVRKQISVRSSASKTASYRTFFSTSEAVGTLKELGLFGDDASGTAGSGTLYARVAIDETKTDQETLTIDWSLSVA